MEEQSPAQEFLALQLCFSHLPGLAPLAEMARDGARAALPGRLRPRLPDAARPRGLVSTARIAALVRHLEARVWSSGPGSPRMSARSASP